MNKVWLIADTHFGDERIIKYENRPFQTVEEMNEMMIKNWNEVVGNGDKVFMLGDFALEASDKWLLNNILCQLNGSKAIVLGNHDKHFNVSEWHEIGFDEVYPYPIIVDSFWILSHEPLYVNSNMPYANVYGHIHNNPSYKDCSEQSFCVSVERIGYKPIAFEEVKRLVAQQAKEVQGN